MSSDLEVRAGWVGQNCFRSLDCHESIAKQFTRTDSTTLDRITMIIMTQRQAIFTPPLRAFDPDPLGPVDPEPKEDLVSRIAPHPAQRLESKKARTKIKQKKHRPASLISRLLHLNEEPTTYHRPSNPTKLKNLNDALLGLTQTDRASQLEVDSNKHLSKWSFGAL